MSLNHETELTLMKAHGHSSCYYNYSTMQTSLRPQIFSGTKSSQATCSGNPPRHQDYGQSQVEQTVAEQLERHDYLDERDQEDGFDFADDGLTDLDDDVDESQDQECNLSNTNNDDIGEFSGRHESHEPQAVESSKECGNNTSHCHTLISSSNNCVDKCCNLDRNEPYQPKLDPKKTKRQQGQQQRPFQNNWFTTYKWLTYCCTKNVAYCFVCRKAKHLGMFTFNKKADDAFLSSGFKNWKNATMRFKKHEKSDSHRVATMRYMAFLKSPGINTLMSNETK